MRAPVLIFFLVSLLCFTSLGLSLEDLPSLAGLAKHISQFTNGTEDERVVGEKSNNSHSDQTQQLNVGADQIEVHERENVNDNKTSEIKVQPSEMQIQKLSGNEDKDNSTAGLAQASNGNATHAEIIIKEVPESKEDINKPNQESSTTENITKTHPKEGNGVGKDGEQAGQGSGKLDSGVRILNKEQSNNSENHTDLTKLNQEPGILSVKVIQKKTGKKAIVTEKVANISSTEKDALTESVKKPDFTTKTTDDTKKINGTEPKQKTIKKDVKDAIKEGEKEINAKKNTENNKTVENKHGTQINEAIWSEKRGNDSERSIKMDGIVFKDPGNRSSMVKMDHKVSPMIKTDHKASPMVKTNNKKLSPMVLRDPGKLSEISGMNLENVTRENVIVTNSSVSRPSLGYTPTDTDVNATVKTTAAAATTTTTPSKSQNNYTETIIDETETNGIEKGTAVESNANISKIPSKENQTNGIEEETAMEFNANLNQTPSKENQIKTKEIIENSSHIKSPQDVKSGTKSSIESVEKSDGLKENFEQVDESVSVEPDVMNGTKIDIKPDNNAKEVDEVVEVELNKIVNKINVDKPPSVTFKTDDKVKSKQKRHESEERLGETEQLLKETKVEKLPLKIPNIESETETLSKPTDKVNSEQSKETLDVQKADKGIDETPEKDGVKEGVSNKPREKKKHRKDTMDNTFDKELEEHKKTTNPTKGESKNKIGTEVGELPKDKEIENPKKHKGNRKRQEESRITEEKARTRIENIPSDKENVTIIESIPHRKENGSAENISSQKAKLINVSTKKGYTKGDNKIGKEIKNNKENDKPGSESNEKSIKQGVKIVAGDKINEMKTKKNQEIGKTSQENMVEAEVEKETDAVRNKENVSEETEKKSGIEPKQKKRQTETEIRNNVRNQDKDASGKQGIKTKVDTKEITTKNEIKKYPVEVAISNETEQSEKRTTPKIIPNYKENGTRFENIPSDKINVTTAKNFPSETENIPSDKINVTTATNFSSEIENGTRIENIPSDKNVTIIENIANRKENESTENIPSMKENMTSKIIHSDKGNITTKTIPSQKENITSEIIPSDKGNITTKKIASQKENNASASFTFASKPEEPATTETRNITEAAEKTEKASQDKITWLQKPKNKDGLHNKKTLSKNKPYMKRRSRNTEPSTGYASESYISDLSQANHKCLRCSLRCNQLRRLERLMNKFF